MVAEFRNLRFGKKKTILIFSVMVKRKAADSGENEQLPARERVERENQPAEKRLR